MIKLPWHTVRGCQGAYLRLKQQQDHSMLDSYRSYFHPKVHQFITLGYALDMFDIWQKNVKEWSTKSKWWTDAFDRTTCVIVRIESRPADCVKCKDSKSEHIKASKVQNGLNMFEPLEQASIHQFDVLFLFGCKYLQSRFSCTNMWSCIGYCICMQQVLSNNMWMYYVCCKICTLGFRTSCTWRTLCFHHSWSLRLSIWWKMLHCNSRSPGTGLYHNLQRPRPWERNQLPETSLNVCVKDLWTSIQCLGHNRLKVGTFRISTNKKVVGPMKI